MFEYADEGAAHILAVKEEKRYIPADLGVAMMCI